MRDEEPGRGGREERGRGGMMVTDRLGENGGEEEEERGKSLWGKEEGRPGWRGRGSGQGGRKIL